MYSSKEAPAIYRAIKSIGKLPILERYISSQIEEKGQLSSPLAKLIPYIDQYPQPTYRKATRNGIHYELDISDFVDYITYYGFHLHEHVPLYKLVEDSSVIFDIGSNIGVTLLNFARLNPQGVNYGFEPVHFIYDKAQKNISLNSYDNIHLQRLALSDKKGIVQYNRPGNRNSSGTGVGTNKREFQAQATTLDEFVSEHQVPQIDLIKIDVEGFEPLVLEGGRQSLKKWKPKLFIEVAQHRLAFNGLGKEQIVDILVSLDYKLFHAQTQEEFTAQTIPQEEIFDLIAQ